MSVSVGWLLENHLIDYKLIGIVNSADMLAVTEQVSQMLSSNPRNTVHVLYDVSNCARIPYDIPNIIKALKPRPNTWIAAMNGHARDPQSAIRARLFGKVHIAIGETPLPDDVYRCETCSFASVCRKDFRRDRGNFMLRLP